jgi:tetratricopeptide (TPR) repeat protein
MTPLQEDAASADAEATAALQRGDFGVAEARFRDAIARYGARPDRLAMLGQILLRLARPREAAHALSAANAALPANPAIELALGIALVQSGEPATALAPLEHAVAAAPADKDAWNALGLARRACGSVDGAGEAFARALEIAPRFTPALVNWCDALTGAERIDEAIRIVSAAVERHPDDPDAWFTLGNLRMRNSELDAARDAYARSAALFPGNAPTHVNLGLVQQWSGRLAEAEAEFRAARAIDPTDPDARFGLATTLLKERKSDEGWALYAQGREGAPDWPGRRIPARAWDGGTIAEGALVVDADQGIGDVLQFARFLPLARERVPRLIVYCSGYQAPAIPLLASMRGIDAIVGSGSGAQAVAAACAISELPHLLRLGDSAFAPVDAYLAPSEEAVSRWASRVAALPGRKIGLCWGGNPRPEYVEAHKIDRRRSIAAERLAWLTAIPGLCLVSLQKGAAGHNKAAFGNALVDWTEELADFGETAALIANLDLVVSVDTSVVHCAGATGAPVFMLDRFDNCWRWGVDPNAPGWYRHLRIFRQGAFGDWTGTLAALRGALDEWARATDRR